MTKPTLEQRFRDMRAAGVPADQIIEELISRPIYDTTLADDRQVIIDASDRKTLIITESSGEVSLRRPLQGLELLFLQEAVRCYLGMLTAEGMMIQDKKQMDSLAVPIFNAGVDACADLVRGIKNETKSAIESNNTQVDDPTSLGSMFFSLYDSLAERFESVKVTKLELVLEDDLTPPPLEGEEHGG